MAIAAPALSRRAAIAQRLGCRVERGEEVTVGGVVRATVRIETRSNDQVIVLLNAYATDDAQNDPTVQQLAAEWRSFAARIPRATPAERETMLARRIHRYVRDSVNFQREPSEVHRSSSVTLALGAGDCDDQSALVMALALASGLRSRIHGLRNRRGEITHACATIWIDGSETWAETTVDAYLGEHPFDAAVRLGLAKSRADITG